MSSYICAHGERFKGKRVLELGSGLGEALTSFSRHDGLTRDTSSCVKCGDVWPVRVLESVFRLQAVSSLVSACISVASYSVFLIS
jgi:hypothetical protein